MSHLDGIGWSLLGPPAGTPGIAKAGGGTHGWAIIGNYLYLHGTDNASGSMLYDFTTDSWAPGPTLPYAYMPSTAAWDVLPVSQGNQVWQELTTLPDGRVYIHHGPQDAGFTDVDSNPAGIFAPNPNPPLLLDPTTWTFEPLIPFMSHLTNVIGPATYQTFGAEVVSTQSHLLGGKIYMVGGSVLTRRGDGTIVEHHGTCVLEYDPATSSWTGVDDKGLSIHAEDNYWHYNYSIPINDHQILFLPIEASSGDTQNGIGRPVVFDTLDRTFTRAANFSGLSGNTNPTMRGVVLPDGKVFLCGNETYTRPLVPNFRGAIFDPTSLTFTPTSPAPDGYYRTSPGVALLVGGVAHVCNGNDLTLGVTQPTTSILYDPATDTWGESWGMGDYLFAARNFFRHPIRGTLCGLNSLLSSDVTLQEFWPGGQIWPRTRTSQSDRPSQGQTWPRTR